MKNELFIKAKPIWLRNLLNRKNSTVLFKVNIAKTKNATLKITASSFYRVFLNKKFIGYGPARAAHNYARIDVLSLQFDKEENEVLIEVAGYNCNSYYCIKQTPFLIAEIVNDKILAATGYDFMAREYKERKEKVARFSFQRTFMEIYDFTCKKDPFSFEDIVCVEDRNYLTRNVHYPTYTIEKCKYVESGSFTLMKNAKMERNRTLISKDLLIYDIDALEDYSFDLLQNARYIKGHKETIIASNQYEIYSCSYSLTGFIKIKFHALEDSDIILTYSEINSSEDKSSPIDVDYKRNDTINIIRYKVNKGAFQYISFEPYTLRYAKIHVIKGAIKNCHIEIVKYENPDTNKLIFKARNYKLNKVMEASRHVLEQNAVDILTDCPSRERAGWLCDSLFSSRAEKLFTGDNKVETNFLENYSLHPDASQLGLPKGTIAMCYPGEYDDHVFIPNWMLFYIIELKENYLRTGNEQLKKKSQKIAKEVLDYLKQFENEYGLLEDLPSWVFVEWSKANSNEFMRGVNFPTNMLYQKAIKDYAFLYDQSFYKKANEIKDQIIQLSYNGNFFVDNAIRIDKNLVRTKNISETCQYYAFYFEVASIEKFHKLYDILLHDFNYNRDESKVHPNVYKSNAFIGNILRYSILVSNGETSRFLHEAIDYYYDMAKVTGTLWEHSKLTCSLNHGFGSYVANLIVESLTGISFIDEKNKIIWKKSIDYITDFDLQIPCKEGYIDIHSKNGTIQINYPKEYVLDGGDKHA